MKRIQHIIPLLAALALPLLNTGCTTLSQSQQDLLARAKTRLTSLSEDAGVLAIQLNPSNRGRVEKAVVALNELLLSETFDASLVKSEVMKAIGSDIKPEIQFAIKQAIGLYADLVDQFVKDTIKDKVVAVELLTALKVGGEKALAQ